MKIVIREWRRDKAACCMLGVWLLLSMIYSVIDARMIILISRCIEDYENWRINVTTLLATGGALTIVSIAQAWFRPMSIHHAFTSMNNRFADKVLDADVEMFTTYSCSYVISMAEYIWQLNNAMISTARFIRDLMSIIITLASIYLVGGKVVVPIIIVHGIGAIFCKYLFHQYDEIDKEADRIKKKRNQEIEDVINGFQEVRTFHTQEHHRKTIRDLNQGIYNGRKRRSYVQMVTNGSFEVVDLLGIVAIILYAINSMSVGSLTQAAAMSLVMYVVRLASPIGNVMDYVDTISESVARAESYDKIVSYREPRPDGKWKMDGLYEQIELRHVYFGYDPLSDILKDISMVFPKGKKIGICGASGAGKSTLFKLLNRFYSPYGGQILVDGVNLNDISQASYYSHVGSVHQDNTIFPGTIRENVMYGSTDASEYAMIQACQNAKIYDFIQSQEDKFDTVVGPRGLTLSGGQKQRIALARLFLRNPDIILLDEATSALDNNSETFIQEAIDALPDKTIITIAHRLSTIQNCDLIYVMDEHGVVECGTHSELMDQRGVYYSMQK